MQKRYHKLSREIEPRHIDHKSRGGQLHEATTILKAQLTNTLLFCRCSSSQKKLQLTIVAQPNTSWGPPPTPTAARDRQPHHRDGSWSSRNNSNRPRTNPATTTEDRREVVETSGQRAARARQEEATTGTTEARATPTTTRTTGTNLDRRLAIGQTKRRNAR